MSYKPIHARKRLRYDLKRERDYYAAPLVSYKRLRSSATEPKEVMAKGRSRTAYGRRSRRGRRRRLYRRAARTVQPFSVMRTLKSVIPFTFNPGAGVVSFGDVYLNSAYDPTGNIASGQPLGYDQYTALYNRYCVVAWSVKLEWCTTDNTVPVVVGFTPSTSSTALTSYSHYKELPGTKSMIITPDIDKGLIFARGGVKKWYVPPGGKLLSNENLSSAVSGNPTNILHGHLWAQAMDATSDPAPIQVICTIWQRTVFFDPVIPARS